MKVAIRESTMVKPSEETPTTNLWLSNLDLHVLNKYTLTVYFYRPNATAAANFFDTKVMKDALSRALVAFYPMAGRLRQGEDGRDVVDCQGQGSLFQEAEADGIIDDFGDFAPTPEFLKLIPVVEVAPGTESYSYPVMMLQVTRFKCGGVSLGVRMHHRVVDGMSALHFISTWSNMARGNDTTIPPFIDRTLLRARDPPRPVFEHIEYLPDPSVVPKAPIDETKIVFSKFEFTRNQLDKLKAKSKENGNTISTSYSSFELLSAHIWKCICKLRGLPDDVDTRFDCPVDGRTRFEPPLPRGFFGNVIFRVNVVAKAGDIKSKPLWYVASMIHDALAKMNDDYLRSALDYLELHDCPRPELNYTTSLAIVSWAKLPFQNTDFGWGRPIFMGQTSIPLPGWCFVLPSPINDGGLSINMGLEVEQKELLGNLLYAI